MKQTVGILMALAAMLLLATGFIVNANIDQSRVIDLYKAEVHTLQKQLKALTAETEHYKNEEKASAEAMKKSMDECDALKRQLTEAVNVSQEAGSALEQQKRQNQKLLQELESLAAEYEDLSLACDAQDTSMQKLNEEIAQATAAYELQTLEDAKRIAQLEAELEKALVAAEPALSYADSEQSEKELSDMMIDVPAQPNEGPAILPTPDLAEDTQPAQPGEGPAELPTPEVAPQPVRPLPQVTLCPLGYSRGIVQNGQTFTDLLLQHDVSWQAMRSANPTLSTTRLVPGTRYCIPPTRSRRLCPTGTESYVMGQFEDLNTLSELFSIAPGLFLTVNTQLAPSDFSPGRVVCVP